MGSRRYQNFDLLIEAEEAGSYRARVTSCPLGESPSTRFTLPFDPTQLENLLLKLDPGRSGTRRAAHDPQIQATMDLGGPLFETVFTDDLRLAWSRSQDAARQSGDGLRLRLRLTDAPAIAGLPWELLYDRRNNSFIAQSEKTPRVRFLEVAQPPRPLVVNGPLRILCVISSPTDLPELDVDGEWAKVNAAMAPKIEQGLVHLDRLPAATMSDLGTWLRRNEVHILHFIGHGDYDERPQDGVLFFCDRYGRSVRVTPSVLGPHMRDHDPLRLVLLNACQSARVNATDPFSGMAQGLIQQDVTAVVAMQFPISDGAATTFTGEFYGALADGLPVDQAVTSARKSLLADYEAEWATPILFLRSPDGQVFDGITPAPREPVVEREAAPSPEPVAAGPRPPRGLAEPGPRAEGAAWPRGEEETTGRIPPTSESVAASPTTAPLQPGPNGPPDSRAMSPSGLVTAPSPARRPRRTVLAVAAVVLVLFLAGILYTTLRLSDDTNGAAAAESTAQVTAARMTTPPTIDGAPTEWLNHPAYASTQVVAPEGAPGTVEGRWMLGWDTQNLYAYVVVKDAQLTQTHEKDPSQLYKGDSVSFELGVWDPDGPTSTLRPNDVHVLLGPKPDNSVIGTMNVAGGAVFVPGPDVEGRQVVAQVINGGYVVEAAMPWSALRVSGAPAGLKLAMNLNVSDAVPSGSRRGELADMVSNNGNRHGNDADQRHTWGSLKLTS